MDYPDDHNKEKLVKETASIIIIMDFVMYMH